MSYKTVALINHCYIQDILERHSPITATSAFSVHFNFFAWSKTYYWKFIYTELCFSISSLWEWHKALTHVAVNTVTYRIWYQYHLMIQNPVKQLRQKVFKYFCKALHLRCLIKFWIQLCEDGSICHDFKKCAEWCANHYFS